MPRTIGYVVWTVVGLIVLVFAASFLVVEGMWMDALGYLGVFWRIRLTQAALFAVGFAVAFVYFGANTVALRRLLRRLLGPGMPLPERESPAWAALPVALGVGFGLALAGQWDAWIRLSFATPFGANEPILGRDLGFYVFDLPFLSAVQSSLVWMAAIGLGGVGLVLHLGGVFVGWWRLEDTDRRAVVRLLCADGALLAAVWGWGYYLDRFRLLYESAGVVHGPGYTDVHVVLPTLWVMVALTVVAVAVLLDGAARGGERAPLIGVGCYVIAAAVGLIAVPMVYQALVVAPNELERERPYLRHNIDFTRRAYGVADVQESPYPARRDLDYATMAEDSDTLRNIRLWDYRPLLATLRQLQEIRLYYRFYDVDIDRYRLAEGYRQVMLSARELAPQLPAEARSWVNRTLQYTHGYGLAMSLAAQEGVGGAPSFIVRDLPPVAERGVKVTQPAIYYGAEMTGYRIVNTGVREFDYPRGDANVYVHYAGKGGLLFDAAWKRWLFSLNRFDLNILFSDYIKPDSRLQIWRRVAERVAGVAPFLRLDHDPYLVIGDDGRLYWIQDAYTTAGEYPYSEESSKGRFNYIRNSVKAVVDAYQGTVALYVIDDADPVLRTYRKAFPGVFRPLSDLPDGLKAHLRYPVDLFEAQVDIYRRYHMTIPQVFYNTEDLWTWPQERYGGNTVSMEPYYILARLPGEERLQFLLMSPLTPQNRDNMIAWIGARSDFPGYGQLVVYKMPKERLVYGPLQIEALVDQDTTISQQLSLWDQRGSRVIRGNLIVVPIERGLLSVEPVYLQAEQHDVPQLKRVIAAYDGRVAMEPTLADALRALFGLAPQREEAPTAPAASVAGGEARAALKRAQEAFSAGDWEGFGAAMRSLEEALGPAEPRARSAPAEAGKPPG